MIFSKHLRHENHTHAFMVNEADEHGWEVREEEDNRIVKRAWLHDWHRVERVITRYMAEDVQLRLAGWTEEPQPLPSTI